MSKTKSGLTANAIKLIAIIAMTIDHVAWTVFPGYDSRGFVVLLHIIGRITAPIMWFFVAEGFYYTKSRRKYALRLLVLSIVSHFAYCFCFDIPFTPFKSGFLDQTSVAWSLLCGLLLLCVFDNERIKPAVKTLALAALCILSIPSNWSCVATMAIFFIGVCRGDFRRQMLMMMLCTAAFAAVYCIYIDLLYGIVQLFTCLAIPILARYNGRRGDAKFMGRLFYFYYPAHLALCGLIRISV